MELRNFLFFFFHISHFALGLWMLASEGVQTDTLVMLGKTERGASIVLQLGGMLATLETAILVEELGLDKVKGNWKGKKWR